MQLPKGEGGGNGGKERVGGEPLQRNDDGWGNFGPNGEVGEENHPQASRRGLDIFPSRELGLDFGLGLGLRLGLRLGVNDSEGMEAHTV